MNINTNIMRFGRTEIGTPVISEYFNSNPWINFGINNDFPQEITRLYQNSSILHSTLIDRKVDMVAGSGFNIQNNFVLNIYAKDNLNIIAKKCTYDKVLFNGFYLNIIWSKDGKSIAQIEHIPYEKIRIAKFDADKERNPDKIDGYYFSKDWSKKRRKENEPLFYADFNPELSNKYPSQILFIKTYSPGLDYYTLPSYNSALNALKLDYEISTYHLKNVQNGLMPGMIIVNKSGIPTAEERAQLYAETKASLAGSDNAGDFIMVYAETPEKAPEFIPVQLNSSDQRFKDLRDQLNNDIMIAHKFTNAIAGIETAGKLGSSQEITEQLMYIQNTVISPIQKELEDTFNMLAKINKITDIIQFNKYVIYNPGFIPTTTSS